MAVPTPPTHTSGSNTLPVPAQPSSSRAMHQTQPQAGPSSYRFGASPSFGGGMSIDKSYGKSYRMSGGHSGAPPGSYGAKFYGVPQESPGFPSFGTSVNMDGGMSFVASSSAFGLPGGASMSSSFRRSYAAAARGDREYNPDGLSSSFASMSFRPGASMGMSFGGNSYSKSQVHSLMNNRARTDAELTKTYECCGETHKGLHELLEHVEDVHPFDDAMDGSGAYPQPGTAAHQQIGFSPQVLAMDLELEHEPSALGTIGEEQPSTGSQRSSMSPMVVPSMPSYPVPKSGTTSKAPTPPGENPTSPPPLQISDILTSPFTDSLLAQKSPLGMPGIGANANPRSKSTSSSSSPPDGSIRTPTTSQQPSPVFNVPKVNPTRVGGFLGSAAKPPPGRFDRAFNEVVAGNHQDTPVAPPKTDQPTAVAPGMLFASAVAGLGIPTAPPVPGQKPTPTTETKPEEAPSEGNPSMGMGMLNGELPQPSLFTTHKPWRCPNPGCNKAYKQSNGLKYHQQKGQCDFAIHDAVDLGLSIEEAEERSRPFVCAVGAGCTKRYRQMNGLKYHYLNSGEHGKYGLRMLQNGTHPQPSGVAALAKKPATTTPTTTPSRPGGAPYHIPSQLGQTRPTGHIASAAPQNGTANPNAPRPFTPGAPGQHGLPRMGVFPTNVPRPVSGAQPGNMQNTNMQQNRPGAPASINGSMIRPGMPIRTNGSGPNTGVGQGGNGSSGSGGPLNGHNSGVSAFTRPAVGQIPPHRPGQPQHQHLNQNNQNQNGRPAQLQMSGFPPLRPPSQGQNGQGQSRSPSNTVTAQQKSPVVPNEPAVQRGRDAVLFAAVETMDL